MDFDLNEEQADIRTMVRQFTEQEIRPHAEIWDEQNHFPREIYTRMAALGLLGMTTPEQYGGSMLTRLSGTMAYEELAKGDMGTAVGVSVHNMVAGLLALFGNEEQRQHWITRLATGEMIGAFSLSEASSGSDAASLQCKAKPYNDCYIINGSKMWVTNGGEADVYLLMARSDGSTGTTGISCFLAENGIPGFSFGKTERKMGLHSSPTRELIFTDCRLPLAHRLGEDGQGFKIALSALNSGRVNIGAIAVGVAQAAFEIACSYARQRQQFGKPIGAFQGIQFMLADMAMKIEAARLLVYEAAYKLDQAQNIQDIRQLAMHASMAKCFASDTAMEVTTNALQILGGAGYVRDYPVERYMRDVKVTQIFEGTNQIQRIVIARGLLGTIMEL